ncbi:peptidoglycan-binding protein [uncultured Devosia sp.]|uniref:peptidoglycan-binding domain-containing protein n=1 Tax=uncultured Devosia sp. TaxID=211434 RepID=UPI0035CC579C
MTATTLTRLPLLAGGAMAASMARFGLWTWSRYMRAPLASTGLMAMVTLTALAGSNALYFQTGRHPAPLFAPSPDVPQTASIPTPAIAPALPQLRQADVPQPVSQQTTSSVNPPSPPVVMIPDAPVGNKQVFELQKKLVELRLFDGSVDGFYGPMTARAIRAFEERNGLEPTGAMSPAIVEAILAADAMGMAPQPVRVATPQPAEAPPVRVAAILPPVPLAPDRPVASAYPAEDAFDAVTNSAAETIDSIVAAVGDSRQTPDAPAIRPMPALPMLAATAQPMPAPVQRVASLEPIAPPPAVIAPQLQVTASTPTATASIDPANDPQLIEQIQRGLASLGFLHGPIDGRPGEATAKAIRTFEIFHNYAPTGQANPQLLGLLRDAGASI